MIFHVQSVPDVEVSVSRRVAFVYEVSICNCVDVVPKLIQFTLRLRMEVQWVRGSWGHT